MRETCTTTKAQDKTNRAGYVYLDSMGNVCFQIGAFHIELIASKILTEIKSVKECDKTGYIVLDTNYGEEFYNIGEAIEELGLSETYNVEELISSVSTWVVKNKSKTIQNKESEMALVIGNISFESARIEEINVIRAINLDNTEHVANFGYDKQANRFIQLASTFPDWKRKYKLWCLVERNTEPLKELLK